MTTQLVTIDQPFTLNPEIQSLPHSLYERAGFTKAAKQIKATKFGYRFCQKKDIQDWLNKSFSDDGYKPKVGSAYDYASLRFSSFFIGSSGIETEENVATVSKYNKKTDTHFEISIVEKPLSEYDRIPPKKIVEEVIEAKKKNVFDELVILEPTTKKIEDPIICGKLKQFPDMYFFISGWIHDVEFIK